MSFLQGKEVYAAAAAVAVTLATGYVIYRHRNKRTKFNRWPSFKHSLILMYNLEAIPTNLDWYLDNQVLSTYFMTLNIVKMYI